MGDLVRKQMYITKAQDLHLKEKAKEYGMKEAELVRQALDLQLNKVGLAKQPASVWKLELQFIDERMRKGQSKGVRNWRRDDLYED